MSKIILFDYFGVVASDAYWYTIKGVERLNGRAKEIEELSDQVNDGRISWESYCKQVAQDLGLSVEQVLDRYQQHNINEGIVRLIHELRATHTVALASNAAADHMRPILERTGIASLFNELFFSSEIGASKPDVRFFEHIFHYYDQPAGSFVFIDDAQRNVEAARQLGMDANVFVSSEETREYLRELLSTN